MKEWNFLARAVLVLDDASKVIYADYLENVNEHPNYEAALAAVQSFSRAISALFVYLETVKIMVKCAILGAKESV